MVTEFSNSVSFHSYLLLVHFDSVIFYHDDLLQLNKLFLFMFIHQQGGDTCSCGNTYGNGGNILATDCTATCAGDSLLYCGGFDKDLIFFVDGTVIDTI